MLANPWLPGRTTLTILTHIILNLFGLREDLKRKKRLNSGIARKWGGLPMPEFFCTVFYLSKNLVNGRDGGKRQ